MVSHRLRFAPRLGRDYAHRRAMLRNMVSSLILHERILTTHPKAKYAQRFAERMIAYAKQNSPHGRRQVDAFVIGQEARLKLNHILTQRYAFRPSGFTRVIHVKRRQGDNAPLSYLEFIDRPGELRPSRICTPQTWQQVLLMREQRQAKLKKESY